MSLALLLAVVGGTGLCYGALADQSPSTVVGGPISGLCLPLVVFA